MIIERGHEASKVDMLMYPVHVMVSNLLSHLMKIFELKLDRIEKSGDQEERFWIFKGSVVIISFKHGLKYGVFLGIRLDQRRSKQCGNETRYSPLFV